MPLRNVVGQRAKLRILFLISFVLIIELLIYPKVVFRLLRHTWHLAWSVLGWIVPTSHSSVSGPVTQQIFADPAFIEADGIYYAFATQHRNDIPVATSGDFKTWTVNHESALAEVGAWSNGRSVWAPDVKKIDDTYVMYYAALPKVGSKHCIGTATSSTPLGPYKAEAEPLLCNDAGGGVIDPFAYVDHDGSVWLIYKVDGNSLGHGGSCWNMVWPQVPTPIMAQRLSSDGLAIDGSSPVQLLDRSDEDGPLVEAPAILRVADGVSWIYFLFFSSQCFSSELYDASYAVSYNGLLGPYIKADREVSPLLKAGYPDRRLSGPGGLSVGLTGDTKVVFHSDHGINGSERLMWTGLLHIDLAAGTVSLG